MPSFREKVKTPEGIALLLSGLGSMLSGDRRYVQGAVERQAAFEQLEMQRELLAERTRRREAIGRLPGLLSDIQNDFSPGGQEARRGELLGLLADVSPEPVVQGLLAEVLPQGRESRTSTIINDMRELGIPLTEDNYTRFKSMGGNGNDLDALQQVQLAKLLLDMQGVKADRDDAAVERGRARLLSERSLNTNLKRMEDLAGYAEDLEGTFLEAGVPLSEGRRALASGGAALGRLLGWDTEAAQKKVDLYDKLKKGLNDLVVDSSGRFTSTLTDNKLNLLRQSMASPDVTTDTIRGVLGEMAEDMRDAADIEGYKLDNRDGYEGFIERMRTPVQRKKEAPVIDVPRVSRDVKAAADQGIETIAVTADRMKDASLRAGAKAVDIARMSINEIRKLDLERLSEEQLKALEKRMDELGLN